MPFKGNRIFVIIIVIAICTLFVVVAIGSRSGGSGSSVQSQRGDPKYKVTVSSESVGLEYIIFTNENTGATIHILPQYLPMDINFAKNDILTFTVVAKENYQFNFWSVSDGTPESDNPLAIKPNRSFTMNALFMPSDILDQKETN
jgi:hypothetical protein